MDRIETGLKSNFVQMPKLSDALQFGYLYIQISIIWKA